MNNHTRRAAELRQRFVIVDDAADELLSGLPHTRVPINLFLDGVPMLSTECARSEIAQSLASASTVTTAGPTVPQYLQALRTGRSHSSHLTICTVTSKLSVSWQNANKARQIYLAEDQNAEVEILDTLHCATAQAAIVDSLITEGRPAPLETAEHTRQLQEFYIIHPSGSYGRKVVYTESSARSSDHIIEMRNGLLTEVHTDHPPTEFVRLKLTSSPPLGVIRMSYSGDRERVETLISAIGLSSPTASICIMSPGVSPHVGIGAVAISWTSSNKVGSSG